MVGLSLRAPKPLTGVGLLRPGLLTYLNLWHSLTLSPLITEETAPTRGSLRGCRGGGAKEQKGAVVSG